jgi:hypothetical protein
LIQALDSTIATVALAYMQGFFAAGHDEINRILNSYIDHWLLGGWLMVDLMLSGIL